MTRAQTISPARATPIGSAADALWYRNAIIYQMHVRSFSDASGDGIGDFAGLIGKLDYLEELGVTAVWLLPFYPSPLKDDGYDIADYTSVNPAYGTIEDVQRFIEEAHRRQLRVITELVINHTSDQHAWFQRARRAPRGSAERDFYVWSDDPSKYSGVRIIFKDFEPSNWTFDHVAGQYYWHRFFHHQPDLNFDNPAVHQAVFDVLDFWMGMGVDGLRLDAVPYLYEREGTSCENLPETHRFLKALRRHVDEKWPGRMLLAEANQWPEDAIAYFGEGDGDECHMNFHFPLMPRLFMSLRREDRYPIIDILEQTPPLPTTGQWAMFLRNHDELTLEMVTDEERDYMWRVYASDPAARINMGIRRRLAPLLENNRRKIELMKALLFSMPGTPILYYGDELGMGDNIFLGDRNGVRTPMQWSGDRNAGFSRANPQRLFLPVIIDPEYHYETINVEAQSSNPSSLLWWLRRLIALRKNHPVFGRGEIRFLTPANPKVLAFIRDDGEEQVLVVANLSRFAQPVELDLSAYAGRTPVEMFGATRFPPVRETGYPLALGPHAFYWFVLEPQTGAAAELERFPEQHLDVSGEGMLADSAFQRLLVRHLPRLLPTRRWFVSKARPIRSVRVIDRVDFNHPDDDVQRMLMFLGVEFSEGEAETYALPLALMQAGVEEETEVGALLRIVDRDGNRWRLRDGMAEPRFARALLEMMMRTVELAGRGGGLGSASSAGGSALRLRGRSIGAQHDISALVPTVPQREQSNSNVIFDTELILKLFRRIGDGINPELEVGEHLTHVGYANTAPLAGAIEITGLSAHPQTLAVALQYMGHQEDAWETFVDHAQRFFETLDALPPEQVAQLCAPVDSGCAEASQGPPEAVTLQISEPIELARLLGSRTAEMHAALADDRGNTAFTPEPYSVVYQRGLLQSMRNTTRATMDVLRSRLETLDETAQPLGRVLLAREPDVMALFRALTHHPIRTPRIRVHGDFHLGQVLWTGKDFIIIDFEGEPLRSIGERRLKRSSMKDVAGMVRSFDYAAWTGLRRHWEILPPEGRQTSRERDEFGARVWGGWLAHEFVRHYTGRLRSLRPDLLPPEQADAELVLRSWVLEKALYEVRYELNARPDWADIPLRAVLDVLEEKTASPDIDEAGSPA